jgi:type VI secretion system protein ImpK
MSTASAMPVPAHLRTGRLAIAFQESLTSILLIKTATNPNFREDIKNTLDLAEDQARKAGYSSEGIESARFAVTAFLDEAVLNSGNPVFKHWVQLIGGDAGEVFFANLKALLDEGSLRLDEESLKREGARANSVWKLKTVKMLLRGDTAEVADLLELYLVCLLLGYRGEYQLRSVDPAAQFSTPIMKKISEIRLGHGTPPALWSLPHETNVLKARDPWVKRLSIVAAASIALCMILLAGSCNHLRSGIDQIRGLSMPVSR